MGHDQVMPLYTKRELREAIKKTKRSVVSDRQFR
jgi:hypothetical protein